jgi:hypothetical protein
MRKYIALSSFLIVLAHCASAQSITCTADSSSHSNKQYLIHGCLRDERGNPVVNSNVVVLKKRSTDIIRDLTDFDGLYHIKITGDSAERCSVRFSYLGNDITITDVPLLADSIEVNAKINTRSSQVYYVQYSCSFTKGWQPLIDPEYPGGHISHSAEMLPKGW